MNNKGNIFEELNKMKSLIHAKAGVVISEQNDDINADIRTIKQQMDMTFANTDEQKVVDVLKKYTTSKDIFQNFLNQYKSITGTVLTDKLGYHFQPDRDSNEIADLNASLQKIGSSFVVKLSDDRKKYIATFGGLGSSTQPVKDGLAAYMNTVGAATPRQAQINSNYCTLKNGIYTSNGLKFDWKSYVSSYNVTEDEIAVAKNICPNVVVSDVSSPDGYKFGDDLSKDLNIQGKDDTQKSNTQKGGTNTVNTRFVKSATDLGVQSGKMDLQSLQSILAKLQDGGSQSTVTQDTSTTTQPAGTTTQQTPDLTQLTSLLNQLNA
jgi:hypothetical protein